MKVCFDTELIVRHGGRGPPALLVRVPPHALAGLGVKAIEDTIKINPAGS